MPWAGPQVGMIYNKWSREQPCLENTTRGDMRAQVQALNGIFL